MLGYMIAVFTFNMPNSLVAVIGSIFPFTSMMVMPMRSAMVTIPPLQMIAAVVLLLASLGVAGLPVHQDLPLGHAELWQQKRPNQRAQADGQDTPPRGISIPFSFPPGACPAFFAFNADVKQYY